MRTEDGESYATKVAAQVRQAFDAETTFTARFVGWLRAGLVKGGVHYVLTLFLVGAAAILARAAELLLVDHYDRLKEDVSSMLMGQFEPRRDESAFGVVAATLSAVDTAESPTPESLCPSNVADCEATERFLRVFVSLAEKWAAIDTLPMRNDIALAAFDEVAAFLPTSRDPKRDEEIDQRFRDAEDHWVTLVTRKEECPKEEDRDKPKEWWVCEDLSLSPSKCESGRNDAIGKSVRIPPGGEASHDGDWGPRFCEATPSSQMGDHFHLSISPLIVPTRPPNAEEQDLEKRFKFDPRAGLGTPPIRAAKAARLSRLLLPALEAAGIDVSGFASEPTASVQSTASVTNSLDRRGNASADLSAAMFAPVGYSLVQAYFISPDDVFRIWQSGKETRFPRTRHWSEQKYFENLMSGKTTDETSSAYIDYGGNGLVRTRCRSIEANGERDKLNHTHELLGVICADTTVPISLLARRLKDGQLLEAHWISAIPDGRGNFVPENVLVQSMDDLVAGRAPQVVRQDGLSARIADEFNAAVSRDRVLGTEAEPNAILTRQVIRLAAVGGRDEAGNRPLFFVPGGAKETALQGFVVRPRVEYPISATYLLGGAAFCFFAALGVGTAGAVRARTRNEGRVIADLLRGLEIGVVIVNEDDEIEAGNDRAEEAFGVTIPRFGPSLDLSRGKAVGTNVEIDVVHWRLPELIEQEIWLVDDLGSATPRLRTSNYGKEVKETREKGDSSTYYAKLSHGNNREKYIRISAVPIGSSRRARQGDWPRTFGFIEAVDDHQRKQIDELRDRSSRRESAVASLRGEFDNVAELERIAKLRELADEKATALQRGLNVLEAKRIECAALQASIDAIAVVLEKKD